MDKITRVKAALSGHPVDRLPYGFWTHFPEIDLDPEQLAHATLGFYRETDIDFLKTMPSGFYCVEDWGCQMDYGDIPKGGTGRVVKRAVSKADDWGCLPTLDVGAGTYGRELDHLRRVVEGLSGEAPVLATVFSPLTIAQKLSCSLSRTHAESNPEALHAGLRTITATMAAFVREAVAVGCAGVFFATQEAIPPALSESAYSTFGEPYDREVLTAARGGWFNVVHIHGESVYFDVFEDYPAHALNWHIGETAPSIAGYREAGGAKPIVGGLVRGSVTRSDMDAIRAEFARAVSESRGLGLLLSPACVIRHPVDMHTLKAIGRMIRGYDG